MKRELTCEKCGQRLTIFCKQIMLEDEVFIISDKNMETIDILLQIIDSKVYCDTCGQEIKEDKNDK